MFKNLWNRIRSWISDNTGSSQVIYKQLIINEYKSVLYAVHRASNLQQLLDVRTRIRNFHQMLIENRLEFWGRPYITDLNKLWNAKFRYWKNKVRKQ
jgi:hypothetical protein